MLTYIITSLIVTLLGNLVFFAINKGKERLKGRIVVGVLVGAASLSVWGLFGAIRSVTDTLWWFILLQAIYLGLGILCHHLLKRRYLGEFDRPILSHALLLLATLALGFGGFVALFGWFNADGIAHLYGMSMLAFLFPPVFMQAFEAYAAIPPEIHRLWYYPIGQEEPDLDNVDLNNIYLVEIEFERVPDTGQFKNNKVRAPVDFVFGDWFRSFIDNYNYRFDQEPIAYLKPDGTSFGWLFTTKPSFFTPSRNIDPTLTIKANRITEKTVIIAQRVDLL